jgi:single-stranded-DNA-specific exonuclease
VPEAAARLEAAGVEPLLAPILARRGVRDAVGADAFLNPDPDQLHDPMLLTGMAAAVARLLSAREMGQRVAVVGDYDVDGVTATAMLQVALSACGIAVETILPHRMAEGYGFQPVHVERAAANKCQVIVTADCGVTAHAAVTAARERGIDVIITDHHLPGAEPLPPGAVLINPKQTLCTYPFDELSGAGLAFKLALALLAAVRGTPQDPTAFLRIACLGTIADLVPLVEENRTIAALGLDALDGVRSPGLLALMREAGVTQPVGATDVGFRLGPRLNAAGRLDSAESALELLLTRDRRRAAELARQLDTWNRQRQAEEMTVVEEARERIERLPALPPVLVEWSEGWHRGVVGIAAGRLAKEFHRPSILLSVEGDTATGSGRSVRGIELHHFLQPWQGELLRFGGHSQAVGLSAATERLESLRAAWCSAAAAWPPEALERRFEYELDLPLALVGWDLLEAFEALEPHGQGNPQPLLKVGPVRLAAPPRSFGKTARTHLGGRLVDAGKGSSGGGGEPVEFVAWGWGERGGDLQGRFEILAYLERDHYRQAPTLRLVDSRKAEP